MSQRGAGEVTQTSSHALPWLSEAPSLAQGDEPTQSPEASEETDEQKTPAIPLKVLSPDGDEGASTATGSVPTATGSVPAQGLTGSRLARNAASKKGRRSVPSWDEILFGSKP